MENASSEEIQIYCAIHEGDDVSPEQRDQSRTVMVTFFNEIDGIAWAIANFPTLHSQETQQFTIRIIAYWCTHRWNDIPPPLIAQLRDLIFNTALHLPHIELIQAVFIFNFAPENWPDFWNVLFTFPLDKIDNFLISFCTELSTLTPSNSQRMNLVRSFFRDSGASTKVFERAIALVQQVLPIGFSILAKFAEWSDISWISDHQYLTLIFAGYNSKECVIFILQIVKAVLTQHHAPQTKVHILTSLASVATITQICQTYDDYDIKYAAAQLVVTAGYLLLPTDNTEYITLAANFAQLENEISSIVAAFYYAVIMQKPELTPFVIECAITRMCAAYEHSPGELQRDFIDDWSVVFVAALFRAPEATNEFITTTLHSINALEEPHKASVMLSIIPRVFEPSLYPQFYPVFEPVLGIPPPLTPTHMIEVSYFAQLLFSSCKLPKDKPIPDMIITYLVPIIHCMLHSNVDEEILKSTIKSLILIVNRVKQPLPVEVIDALISFGYPDACGLAGALITHLTPEAQIDAFTRYVPALQDPKNALYFLKHLRQIPQDTTDRFMEMLNTLRPIAFESDELLALFIGAVRNQINPTNDMVSVLMELVQLLKGPESLKAMSELVTSTCTSTSQFAIAQLAQPYLAKAIPMVMSLAQPKGFFDLCKSYNNTNRVSCIYEFANAVANMHKKKMLDEAFLPQLFALIHLINKNNYDSYLVSRGTVELLICLARVYPNEIATEFTISSMSFLYAKNFNPSQKLWRLLSNKMFELHNTLNQYAPAIFLPLFSQLLSLFGFSETDVANYLTLDSHGRDETIRQFYQTICLMRGNRDV